MQSFYKYLVLTIVSIVIYAASVFIGTDKGWWYKPFTQEKMPNKFINSVKEELKSEFVGNLAIAVFEDGKLASEFFYSKGKPVDRNTVFQVASLSKFVSTIGIMKLVQDGKLNLDVAVSQYLTRWQLPKSQFDNDKVTVRRLLSHTAGLADGLGYAGFENPSTIQSLEASLTNAKDADPGSDGILKINIEPGSEWRYSGGGFTLLQLIVEEVSGQTFDAYMKTEVFEPLQMTSSFYQWDESFRESICEFYRIDGSVAQHRYYTAQAASALYTTLADIEKLFYLFDKDNEIQKPLSIGFQKKMRQVEAKTLGAPIYGLGTFLFTELENREFVIGHDGKNNPPINTAFRYNPISNSGIILLATGSTDFATRIASDWVFIKTGNIDALLFLMQLDKMIQTIIFGCITILILVIFIWLLKRSQLAAKLIKR